MAIVSMASPFAHQAWPTQLQPVARAGRADRASDAQLAARRRERRGAPEVIHGGGARAREPCPRQGPHA